MKMHEKKERKQPAYKIPNILGVKVLGNSKQDLEFALQRFKQLVKDADLLNEIKERSCYIKPSVKKRRSLQRTIRNRIFQEQRDNADVA